MVINLYISFLFTPDYTSHMNCSGFFVTSILATDYPKLDEGTILVSIKMNREDARFTSQILLRGDSVNSGKKEMVSRIYFLYTNVFTF